MISRTYTQEQRATTCGRQVLSFIFLLCEIKNEILMKITKECKNRTYFQFWSDWLREFSLGLPDNNVAIMFKTILFYLNGQLLQFKLCDRESIEWMENRNTLLNQYNKMKSRSFYWSWVFSLPSFLTWNKYNISWTFNFSFKTLILNLIGLINKFRFHWY